MLFMHNIRHYTYP